MNADQALDLLNALGEGAWETGAGAPGRELHRAAYGVEMTPEGAPEAVGFLGPGPAPLPGDGMNTPYGDAVPMKTGGDAE